MKSAYLRAMDELHRLCVIMAGASMVIIAVIIPWGVFTRYVLNSASSWPEPLAVLLMIWLSFMSAIICYREYLHMGVNVLPDMLEGASKTAVGVVIELCMAATNLFLLWFGVKLCMTTWHQSIAEFPIVSVGVSYLPVPIGGAITALFVIERFLTGAFFPPPVENALDVISTE